LPGLSWEELIDPRRVALVGMLGAFVVTAALTRWLTRRIRAGQQQRAQGAGGAEAGQRASISALGTAGMRGHPTGSRRIDGSGVDPAITGEPPAERRVSAH